MGWYRVIKTIKGHRYLYEQRTWREGKHVRTESRYIGPADGSEGKAPEPHRRRTRARAEPDFRPERTLYHGSRMGIEGVPEASESGTFGPGFYLSTRERAERYATYAAKIASDPAAYGTAGERFQGTVYAVEISHLNLKVLTWSEYLSRCEGLDPSGAATPAAKAKLQERLREEGYDGIEIHDPDRAEVVIFPASLSKLQHKPVNTTPSPPLVTPEIVESAFAALLDPTLIQPSFDQAWSWERGFAGGKNLVEPIEALDTLYVTLRVQTTELVDTPSFSLAYDIINIPPRKVYYHTDTHTATERYYRSKMHELIHWTGSEKRLNRLSMVYDLNSYAREELVAEAGALILLKTLGYAAKDLSAHATYFNGWLKRVENREEALVFARREAEKAVHYLLEHGTKHL